MSGVRRQTSRQHASCEHGCHKVSVASAILPLPKGEAPSKRPARAQLKSSARLVTDFINTIGPKRPNSQLIAAAGRVGCFFRRSRFASMMFLLTDRVADINDGRCCDDFHAARWLYATTQRHPRRCEKPVRGFVGSLPKVHVHSKPLLIASLYAFWSASNGDHICEPQRLIMALVAAVLKFIERKSGHDEAI